MSAHFPPETYFIVLMLVNHATFSWLMWEYEYRIRHGGCRSLCYAPIYPIHADIADNISFKLNAFMFLLPISAGLAIVFRATLPPHSEGIGGICASAAVGVHRALFGGMDTGDRSVLDDAGKCHQPDVLCRSVVSLRAGCAAVLLPFRWTIGFPAKLLPG